MTNSNENELKVGDVVSYCIIGSWHVGTVNYAHKGNKNIAAHFTCGHDCLLMSNAEWQRGIHPSLLPDGLLLDAHIEISRLKAENQKQSEELEAARKDKARFDYVLKYVTDWTFDEKNVWHMHSIFLSKVFKAKTQAECIDQAIEAMLDFKKD